jgi:hypothetical protein
VNNNVIGCIQAVRADKIADVLKKWNPDVIIRFRQDRNDSHAFRGYSGNFDNSYAGKEWGWKPDHDTTDRIIEWCMKEMQSNRGRYGI